MTDKEKWRPAPETRRHLHATERDMFACLALLAQRFSELRENHYHEAAAYAEARRYMRETREYMRQIEHLLMIQQGLEHKTYIDIVCSGILALGDTVLSLKTVERIRREDDHD